MKTSCLMRSRSSPLEWRAWQIALAEHLDQTLAEYLVRGIRDGFRIGFSYGSHSLRSLKGSMQSGPSGGGQRILGPRVHGGQDSRAVTSRGMARRPGEQIWGHSKRKVWNVATNCGPVVTGGEEC